MRNANNDIRIDVLDLSHECATHADIFLYWAQEKSKALKKRDSLKRKVKKTEAVLRIGFLSGKNHIPIDASGKMIKLTIDTLQSLIENDTDYGILQEELHTAEIKLVELMDICEAMQQRRSMLNNIVRLIEGEYFDTTQSNSNKQREMLNKKNSVGGNNE